jgi:hypothetical protein
MKMTCRHLIILIAIAFVIIVPVSADAVNTTNTTNTTAVPTTTETTLETTVTTQVTTEATTTTVAATTTTAVPTTTTVAPVTTAEATIIPTTPATTGNLTVASTPMGAAILIDGIYHGTTPGTLTGLPAGSHILRLALSGYYDYEGTTYVVAGQENHAFGTLVPLSGYSSAQSTTVATAATTIPTAAPVIIVQTVQPVATETSSSGPLESPTVIAAIIGIITACIGAGATVLTHKGNVKPEEKKEEKP